MGLVVQNVVFENTAPSLSRIVERIVEIGGLPLEVQESNSEIRGDLFDLHARISFECLPGHGIKVYTYRAGAVKELLERAGLSKQPVAKVVEGVHERIGAQTVYLEGYRGQDLTIMDVATLALETLGGRPRNALPPKVRQKYAKPVSAAQLNLRKQSLRLRGALSMACAVLATPFVLIYVACCIAIFYTLGHGYRGQVKRR
jgi:hypothetical protein